jgi:predicted DNA-binding antitoxin AbrB/MazE fold protein
MTQISATWTGGTFKPDEAVPLPDQTRVRLTVEPIDEWSPERAKAALKSLLDRLRDHPIRSGLRYTREELHERR